MDKKISINKTDITEALKISCVLCIICAAVALVLSFVNSVTAARIAENIEAEKKDAIIALFGSETVEYTPFSSEESEADEILTVYDKGSSVGYCVSVSPDGFGGEMNLIVGFDTAGTVLGVRIVSHSETPGLGSRVEMKSFLSQFNGKNKLLIRGEDYDVISGSTVSSEAIAAGVDIAIRALGGVLGGGAEN